MKVGFSGKLRQASVCLILVVAGCTSLPGASNGPDARPSPLTLPSLSATSVPATYSAGLTARQALALAAAYLRQTRGAGDCSTLIGLDPTADGYERSWLMNCMAPPLPSGSAPTPASPTPFSLNETTEALTVSILANGVSDVVDRTIHARYEPAQGAIINSKSGTLPHILDSTEVVSIVRNAESDGVTSLIALGLLVAGNGGFSWQIGGTARSSDFSITLDASTGSVQEMTLVPGR
jgi:hypothetical protein